MIKSSGIYKLDNGMTIVHSERSITGSGSYASAPYFIEESISYNKISKQLLQALEQSLCDAPEPINWQALQKNHLKEMGFKTLKNLHNKSLYVSVYVKEGNYYISPTINKGSRLGFHYTKDKIVVPEKSNIDDLEKAIEKAFEMCS